MSKKHDQKHAKKKGGSKRPTPTKPVSAYPTDWFFFHREVYTARQLQEVFLTFPDLDVEIWPELNVLENTFPTKVFVDFEGTDASFDDEAGQRFLAENGVQTCYLVTFEPVCNQPELSFLEKVAQKTGGFFAADTEDFTPLIRG